MRMLSWSVLAVVGGFALGSMARADEKTFTLTDGPDQKLNLMSSSDVELTIKAGANYNGTVKLSITRDELDGIDKGHDVVTTVTPATVTLAAGESKKIMAHIEIASSAPDIAATHFHVEGVDATNSQLLAECATNLSIKPVIEIGMHGGPVPEKWDSPQALQIRRHQGGVMIRFKNMDTIRHILHSNGGPVPHQNTGANDGLPGSAYEVRVVDGATPAKLEYYCHVHENRNLIRTVMFNALPME